MGTLCSSLNVCSNTTLHITNMGGFFFSQSLALGVKTSHLVLQRASLKSCRVPHTLRRVVQNLRLSHRLNHEQRVWPRGTTGRCWPRPQPASWVCCPTRSSQTSRSSLEWRRVRVQLETLRTRRSSSSLTTFCRALTSAASSTSGSRHWGKVKELETHAHAHAHTAAKQWWK